MVGIGRASVRFYSRRAYHHLEEDELNNDFVHHNGSRAGLVIDKGVARALYASQPQTSPIYPATPDQLGKSQLLPPCASEPHVEDVPDNDGAPDNRRYGAWVFLFLAAAAPTHGMPAGIRMTRGAGFETPSPASPRPLPLLNPHLTSFDPQQTRLHSDLSHPEEQVVQQHQTTTNIPKHLHTDRSDAELLPPQSHQLPPPNPRIAPTPTTTPTAVPTASKPHLNCIPTTLQPHLYPVHTTSTPGSYRVYTKLLPDLDHLHITLFISHSHSLDPYRVHTYRVYTNFTPGSHRLHTAFTPPSFILITTFTPTSHHHHITKHANPKQDPPHHNLPPPLPPPHPPDRPPPPLPPRPPPRAGPRQVPRRRRRRDGAGDGLVCAVLWAGLFGVGV